MSQARSRSASARMRVGAHTDGWPRVPRCGRHGPRFRRPDTLIMSKQAGLAPSGWTRRSGLRGGWAHMIRTPRRGVGGGEGAEVQFSEGNLFSLPRCQADERHAVRLPPRKGLVGSCNACADCQDEDSAVWNPPTGVQRPGERAAVRDRRALPLHSPFLKKRGNEVESLAKGGDAGNADACGLRRDHLGLARDLPQGREKRPGQRVSCLTCTYGRGERAEWDGGAEDTRPNKRTNEGQEVRLGEGAKARAAAGSRAEGRDKGRSVRTSALERRAHARGITH
eukprot:scaffold88340_cov24-Tisochrysis_lutea.AAC.1